MKNKSRMEVNRPAIARPPDKVPTGIVGFDEITGGGIPCGRTLLLGEPGSVKTILALEFLVHDARSFKEPRIFVAFEETSKRILANARGFDCDLPELQRGKLSFVDAQPAPELVQSGSFDLVGMLAALQAKVEQTGARRTKRNFSARTARAWRSFSAPRFSRAARTKASAS